MTTLVTLSNPSFFIFEYTYSLIDELEIEQKARGERAKRNEKSKAERERKK